MPIQSPALRQHLTNIQNEIDAKKLHELQKLDLYNERTFYRVFVQDMLNAKKEIVIYSPFVSKFRSEFFRKSLTELRRRNIPVFIFTRPLEEHDYLMRAEISCAIKDYEELGVCVFKLPGLIHEKAAIVDREILWEGSLNILSQRESREMMRRIQDETVAMQIMTYLDLNKKLAESYKFQYERLYRNLIANSKHDFARVIKKFLTEIIFPTLKWCLLNGYRIIKLGINLLINRYIESTRSRH
jgi:phosphatidylserine/phosphatidylglycerophosphate/cardiolipin synthase-like enzyme